jgi:ubiquinol oxidase
MDKVKIDLKKEQQASNERPRLKYTLIEKFFFLTMDIMTGRKTTLSKAKLIEMLAGIPYRAWEIRQYARMTRLYKNLGLVDEAYQIMEWGREAQDNEYWHLLIINEKMKEDGIKDAWYLFPVIPFFMILSYVIMTRVIAFVNIRLAFRFNATFEDHAEHVYAQFVADNPEWEKQPVKSEKVKEYGEFDNWADVFRRIGLDERDHMNNSFVLCGKPECVVKYDGMPELPKLK